jgi:hypothetical protein
VNEPIEELREAAAGIPEPPEEMSAYLAKVRERAYTVTDTDVDALRQRFEEDEIFEQTVAAAIGEGLRRLDRAAKVIG